MFSGAEIHESVPLSEQPGRVAIASYEPVFDPDRKLWACDLAVDMAQLPWGEWPFVRLALARHQPEALFLSRLSKVVRAQWAQLAPDRALKVTRTGTHSVDVELRGRGRLVPDANKVFVAFEVADGPDPDELDWRRPEGGDPLELDFRLWEEAIPHAIDAEGGEELVWAKTSLEPPVPIPAGLSVRLVVRELERRDGEGSVGRGAIRIVYADDVRLV
jgi:hypothetical protein